MEQARVLSVHVGKVAPLGPEGVPSAFVKSAVSSSVRINSLGVTGDEQADLSVHGGLEKAVYGYSYANYAAWRADHPQHASKLLPGAFGENLCIEGLHETDLCVGDIHRIGDSRLQVCQPREPCFKLALHFEDNKMPKAMVRSGRAGWYYRVIEEGKVTPGDAVILDYRPNPDFSFARLVQLISHRQATPQELERMQTLPGLASAWQRRAQDWVASREP